MIPLNIKDFSIEMKAGQRLIVGFDGTEFNDDLKFLIDTLKVGGIILFARNIVSPSQIKNLTGQVQTFAASCGLPPLFIAVDQEGGTVARLKEPFTLFPKGNPGINSTDDARYFAEVTAKELKDVGFNMDMAPVMDVEPPEFSGIMHDRVFKGGIKTVSTLGRTVIEHLQKNNVMAVAKHFPGIGRTTLDSHLELPYLNTPLEELEKTDFVPFQASIDQGVSGIMLSHILYEKIDKDWPASLSEKVANHLLRGKMGFNGLVMTDDLDMKAISQDIYTQIHRILLSEIDIALICHKGPNIEIAFREIQHHLNRSEALHEKGNASLARIIKMKEDYLA